MELYISKLIINNYKSIKNETFLFKKGINILVGKNNAGKSNIVSALDEILGDKFNSTSYEDKIFYDNGEKDIERNFKIIAEIDEVKNLEYSLLENIKKSIGLIDITEYFNENDNDFDSEVDLENGIIYVKHNVYDKPKDDKGRWFINSTKTINGIRTLHMCDTLLIALKNYKNKQIGLKRLFGNKYISLHLKNH